MSLEPTEAQVEQLCDLLNRGGYPATVYLTTALWDYIRDQVLETAAQEGDDTDDNYIGRRIAARIRAMKGKP